MSRSPKFAARQSRREARTSDRKNRQSKRGGYGRIPTVQNFEEEAGLVPVKASEAPLIPLTERQADYDKAIRTQRVVYGIGPAGTGKTWYAVNLAAEMLVNGEVEKIYLTRPTIGTDDEKLGFLPGDLEEKYEPYLRPFRDAFVEKLGTGHFEYLLRKKIIEPVPLAFLRGATIKNAIMLADEMQNATVGQMKMLLTRMGKDSKFIINGDPRQIDLDHASQSGLEFSAHRLLDRDVRDTVVIRFDRQDIVRDDIVQDIIEAFED
jgi:phosphate starvation-inducible PhoH-like protein